ncbi:MAG: hypothetical protein F7C81_04640 [Desulfurococcales archaeon]|nr:hypothetical protein [Desulfurococcales archaeon]
MLGRRRVAVPYNIVEAGDAKFGLDAHYWWLLDKRYRVAFLVKPVDALALGVDRDAVPLPIRVGVSEQLRELKSIVEELSGRVDEDRRELRRSAAVSALLYPIPVRRDESVGERYVAYYILSRFKDDMKPLGTRMWLHFTVKRSSSGVSVGDKSYNWLISREPRLRKEIEMLLEG